jgi:hypothetical protein
MPQYGRVEQFVSIEHYFDLATGLIQLVERHRRAKR